MSPTVQTLARIAIGSVGLFHALYSKILNGISRHRLIVGKILGPERALIATRIVGALECLLAAWAFAPISARRTR